MAKTAMTQLQDQIEAIRREAYAAGYAAAMQSIREFAAKPPPGAEPSGAPVQRRRPTVQSAPAAPPARQRQPRTAAAAPRARRTPATRPQRGTNARLVEE